MTEGLTEKESAIVRAVAEGKTSAEIAQTLCLSTETIKWYRKRLLHRYDAKNFTSLYIMLRSQGLI